MTVARQYLSIILFIICLLMAGTLSAAAEAVWVDRWESEGTDIYVLEETLDYGTSPTGKWISVSTRMVSDNGSDKVIEWRFSKYQSDMWRYETSLMDGKHTTVVMPSNKVFAYVMNEIGWEYEVRDFWVY